MLPPHIIIEIVFQQIGQVYGLTAKEVIKAIEHPCEVRNSFVNIIHLYLGDEYAAEVSGLTLRTVHRIMPPKTIGYARLKVEVFNKWIINHPEYTQE